MCVFYFFVLVTASLDAIFMPAKMEPFSRGQHWEPSTADLLQPETCLSQLQAPMFWHNFVIPTLMKTRMYSGSFNSTRNPKYWIPALERKQIQSVPHTQHIRITSLPYLQLQEGDVEELVQVLEAKAVLHGRLSIAEIGGARRPVPSRRGEHCNQHTLQTLHRTELHTRSHPTNQPPTLKCSPGGHSAWTHHFVCSQNSHWRGAEGGYWHVTVSCACQAKKYSVRTLGCWFPKLGIHSFTSCSFHSEGFYFKTIIKLSKIIYRN